jgi:hypothetical protein
MASATVDEEVLLQQFKPPTTLPKGESVNVSPKQNLAQAECPASHLESSVNISPSEAIGNAS